MIKAALVWTGKHGWLHKQHGSENSPFLPSFCNLPPPPKIPAGVTAGCAYPLPDYSHNHGEYMGISPFYSIGKTEKPFSTKNSHTPRSCLPAVSKPPGRTRYFMRVALLNSIPFE